MEFSGVPCVLFLMTILIAEMVSRYELVVIFLLMILVIFSTEGFKLGSERHTTEVTVQKSGALQMTSGIEGLALLKTTKVNLFLYTNALYLN